VTDFRISTPVKDYTGVVGGCAFARGVYVGPVEPGPLGYFRQAGYTVEELPAAPADASGIDDETAVEPAPAKPAKARGKAPADKGKGDEPITPPTQEDDQ
jgi:hypothetical protein